MMRAPMPVEAIRVTTSATKPPPACSECALPDVHHPRATGPGAAAAGSGLCAARAGAPVDGAAGAVEAITLRLARDLGQPTSTAGRVEAPYLAAAPLRTATMEYRYSDYMADVTATNLRSGVAVREHYMSARD